jgi:hypothetical protein
VDRVLMRVRTQPFTSTAKSSASGGGTSTSSASGGDHRHKVATWVRIESSGVWTGSQGSVYDFAFNSSGGAPASLGLAIRGAGDVDEDIWTEGASGNHTHAFSTPDHTHPLDYGIYRDGLRPVDVTITVNGVNVTPSPIGTGGSDLDTTIDITEAVIGKVGGFRTAHDCVISCVSGQGEVLVNFDVYESITPFKFGA